MEQYTLSFCKLIKHNESFLEAIIDNGVDIGIEHANEGNQLLNSIFKEPYGVLVDVRNDFSFTYERRSDNWESKIRKKG